MTTIHETARTIQCDTTLRTLAATARTRYAGEAARIDRALVIALNRGVTVYTDGTASVQSCSNAEVVYQIAHGTCDCPDFPRAPEGRCKHRFAVCLVKKATALMAEDTARNTYYATYSPEDGATYQGTAQYQGGRGWVFRSEADDYTAAYADHAHLVLGGNVAMATAQWTAEGSLVARVCTHHGARRNEPPRGHARPLFFKEMPMCEPCMCGSIDCDSCGPLQGSRVQKRAPYGSLDAEDMAILHEQAATDEEAERHYRRYAEDMAILHEQAATDEEAERYYRRYVEDGPDADPNTAPVF